MNAEPETSECPLCKGQVAIIVSFEGDTKFTHFRCPRCGEFGADKHCALALRDEPQPGLSGIAREMSEWRPGAKQFRGTPGLRERPGERSR